MAHVPDQLVPYLCLYSFGVFTKKGKGSASANKPPDRYSLNRSMAWRKLELYYLGDLFWFDPGSWVKRFWKMAQKNASLFPAFLHHGIGHVRMDILWSDWHQNLGEFHWFSFWQSWLDKSPDHALSEHSLLHSHRSCRHHSMLTHIWEVQETRTSPSCFTKYSFGLAICRDIHFKHRLYSVQWFSVIYVCSILGPNAKN